MKNFDRIENELRGLQDSLRTPKARGGPKNPLPMPEGEIAAKSVQFLLGELKAEIEHRDHATDAARIAEEALATCKVEVQGCRDYIAELKGRIVAMEVQPDVTRLNAKIADLRSENHALSRLPRADESPSVHAGDNPPVPRSIYNDAIARIERLEARLTSEMEVFGELGSELARKDREIDEMKEQITVNRLAALAMFQKLKAASVMAQNATASQVAIYLSGAVRFHLNGALEEVQKLNAEQRQDQDDQHITDG